MRAIKNYANKVQITSQFLCFCLDNVREFFLRRYALYWFKKHS